MSGIEVAGLVLGAIPLLISALEHYGDGLSTLQRWRKYERELHSLVRNLQTERVKLQNVYEKLLVGIVPPSQIETMIEHPLGDLWREADTERKIRARLWKAFDVFEATVKDMNAAIEEMRKKIDSQNEGKVSELKRGVFTLRRGSYAEFLSTIRDGISNLENLTDRNMELEPMRRVRSQGKLLQALRDISRSIYRALRTSLDCTCRHHDVGLRLERRSVDLGPAADDDEIARELVFQLAVSYEVKASDNGTADPRSESLAWQELVIKAASSPRTEILQRKSSETSGTSSLPRRDIKGKKKTVSFGFLQPTVWSPTSTITTTELHESISSLTIGVASIGLSNLGMTLNLCEKLQTTHTQIEAATFGTIIDEISQKARKYTVSPATTLTQAQRQEDMRNWSVISLAEVLQQQDQGIPLSYRDRLQLAVILSSSILQLYGTPWLPAALSSRNIFFIRKSGFPLFYERPILVKKLPDGPEGAPTATQMQTQTQTPFSLLLDRNPALLSLGFLLTELILGKTIESLRLGAGTQAIANTGLLAGGADSDLLSNYIAAQTVLPKVGMVSSNYGTAVARCMDGELHRRGCGLDSETLSQEVYSGVVALLEKDLENS